MNSVVAIALGGSVGAVMRHYAVLGTAALLGVVFPYGTLFVNVFGSFVMGVVVEGAALKWNVPLELKLFLVTGFLGAFTTFSAFSLDVLKLVEANQYTHAFAYVLASVVLSIGAIFAAMYLMRGVLG